MPQPKRKKKKLARQKRSKSWDEEAAKQEQKRRENASKRRGSLALRKDVVNKTLLRSIKRLISQKFEECSKITDLPSSEQKDQFLKLIDDFIQKYFPAINEVTTIEDTSKEEDFILSQSGIKFMVGLLASQNLAKSHFKSIKERTFFYLFYDLLKKYSHRKLVRLLNNDNFIFVVATLRENGGLDEIIAADPTCNKNPQIYYDAANSFIERFL